jgi:hypothetical protein
MNDIGRCCQCVNLLNGDICLRGHCSDVVVESTRKMALLPMAKLPLSSIDRTQMDVDLETCSISS